MTETQWAEFAGLGFALAVLAWAVFRLTGSLVAIFRVLFPEGSAPKTTTTTEEVKPDEH